jgi:hypothetical protein
MVVNDAPCAYASLPGFTGTTVSVTGTGTLLADSPLATTEITGGNGADYYKYRLVSCVAEITYIGPNVARNGITSAVFAHSGYTLYGANINGLKSSRHCQTFPTSERTVSLVLNPTADGVLDPYEWLTVLPNTDCGLFIVDGSADSGPYLVEIYANFELIPPLTVTGGITGDMGLSTRHSDPAAMAMSERTSAEPSAFDRIGEYSRRLGRFVRWGMEFARGYAGPMAVMGSNFARIEL